MDFESIANMSLQDKIQKLFKSIAIRKEVIAEITEEYDNGLESFKNYAELEQEIDELSEELKNLKTEYANSSKGLELKERMSELKKENKEDGEILSEFLNKEVILLDVFSELEVPENFRDSLKENNSKYAVVSGLALKNYFK